MLNKQMAAPFPQMMGQVARALLGEPNKRMSSAVELRYGTKGSLSIDLTGGAFFDHEIQEGGGVIDLVAREIKCDKVGAVRWLTEQGFIDPTSGGQSRRVAASPAPLTPLTPPTDPVFYDYADEGGEIVFKVERCPGGRVPFRHHGPDGNGGFTSEKGCMDGVRRVLYHLPDLLALPKDRLVYLAEGEKDADRLRSLGLPATTNSGGARNFLPELADYFVGRKVALLEDNDDAGRARTLKLAPMLAAAGADVVVVRFTDLAEHGDVSDWLDAGHSKADLIALVRRCAVERNRPQTPLPLVWFDEIEPAIDSMWVVKKLLPMTGLALIYGHPGSGKSFLALDLGFHIALGWDWCGRKVVQGLVIYIAAEGQAGLRNRVTAFRREHDIKGSVPFVLIPVPLDLHDPEADTNKLIETIKAAEKMAGAKAAMVVIDTLSKTMGSGKENGDDMATYVANCGRVAAAFECLVVPVHHRPKDSESIDPRGHSSLRGGVDTTILVEAGSIKRARVVKQKDGDEGDTFRFELKSIHLGTDSDGESVTSCVCAHVVAEDSPVIDPVVKATQKLTSGQTIALRLLGDAIAANGHAVPTDIPDGSIDRHRVGKVVAIEIWRDMFTKASRTTLGHVDAGSPGQVPDTKSDTTRRTFLRYVQRLQALGIVAIYEDYAWLTHSLSDAGRTGAGQVPDTPHTDTGQVGHPLYKRGVPVRGVRETNDDISQPADEPIDGWDL